jgi:hypothetical protein
MVMRKVSETMEYHEDERGFGRVHDRKNFFLSMTYAQYPYRTEKYQCHHSVIDGKRG